MSGGLAGVLGIDPGGTSGLFLGVWADGARAPHLHAAWQCDLDSTPQLAAWICGEYDVLLNAAGIEQWDGRRRGKQLSGGPSAARMRELVTTLEKVAGDCGIRAVTLAPGTVKPWATDRRLEAAGLLKMTSGMPRHARDAARVALHVAVQYLGVRDPLSRRRDRAVE